MTKPFVIVIPLFDHIPLTIVLKNRITITIFKGFASTDKIKGSIFHQDLTSIIHNQRVNADLREKGIETTTETRKKPITSSKSSGRPIT